MRIALLTLLLFVGAICSPAQAQTEPMKENQKAVLVFDIRFDMIRDCELAKSLNLEEHIKDWAAQQADAPNPNTITRVFGAMSAPESMEKAQGIAMGEMPLEFFVKIKFTDEAAATEMLEKAKADGSESFEKGGKTYYRPPAGGGTPEGMAMHQVDATTLEFGTDAYIFHPNQPEVFTAGLKDAWSKVPNEAIRLAMDLDGAKGMIKEAVEMGKQGADGMTSAYLDLIDNAKNVRLSIDLAGENLLTLKATGVNESEAEELRSGLDAVLGIAKMAGGSQVAQVKQMDEAAGSVMETLLKSLKAAGEGEEVSVVIPKPSGFDEAVKGALEKFGGMGGPGPGNESGAEAADGSGELKSDK